VRKHLARLTGRLARRTWLVWSARTHALTVSKYPSTVVSHEVAGLIGLSHGCSFSLVLGIPTEALPPNAAIRFRSSGLSLQLRASPAFRTISLH